MTDNVSETKISIPLVAFPLRRENQPGWAEVCVAHTKDEEKFGIIKDEMVR
jgi:hypothetical protein